MSKQPPFDLAKMRDDAVNNRYRFVCSPRAFTARYGLLTKKDEPEALKYVCLCKDGMIRPR